MVAVGKILRFDEVRGYGFIAPAAGGEDVFVHANDFGEHRHLVRPGLRVEYEVEQGERGLKVASVRLVDEPVTPGRSGVDDAGPGRADADLMPPDAGLTRGGVVGDDDGMCDVLAARAFLAEVTEVLLRHAPSLTGTQITQVRQHLVDYARSHGWVEG
ncbi:cold-shock protein [Plantactinospora sp. GCM10030261]|uniref:cold-shock protein n=1 Tax=Plantactinospora sp. GCM10030261 TaxID=3273420 RepID=UPI003620F549